MSLPPLPPPKPNSGRSTPQHHPTTAAVPPLPETPFIPPQLANKSVADLQYLLHSPSHLDSLFTATHPTSLAATAALTDALTRNQDLATRLLEREKALVALRAGVQQKLVDTRALEKRWREREEEMYRGLKKFSSPDMYARLLAGVEEGKAEMAEMERALLEGGVEVGAWVRGYREVGKRVVLRRERVGRWDEGRVGGWR